MSTNHFLGLFAINGIKTTFIESPKITFEPSFEWINHKENDKFFTINKIYMNANFLSSNIDLDYS